MINKLSNILKQNNSRDLFMDFFNALSIDYQFNAAEVYIFPPFIRKIDSFRYIKGRLYEKSFDYKDMDNTLVEEIFVNKEKVSVHSSDLFNKKSMAKDSYYFDLDANLVLAYPLIDGNRLNGIITFSFADELDVDLSSFVEFINIKLTMLNSIEHELQEKETLKKILLKQGVHTYKIGKDISEELLNHHNNTKIGETKTIKNDNKYYELIKMDSASGYLADITTEIGLKISESLAYQDPDTKLNNINKLQRMIDANKNFSVLEITFKDVYLFDVTKSMLKLFKRSELFRSESSIFVYFDHSDKRLLNKAMRLIKESLGNIMTFEYQFGIIRVPHDVEKDILKVLKIITISDHDYYDKTDHIDIVNVLVTKRVIIDKISNESYELKFHPIVNTKNQLEGYLVTHGIDTETIKDKRIELLITEYTLKTIKRVQKRVDFFIDISEELVKSDEFLTVIKQFRQNTELFKRIFFIFDSVGTEAEAYLVKKESKIARRSVESLYKQEKTVDFIFQNIVYEDYSNEYIDFLGKLEEKHIIPIFEVDNKRDLQFIIDNKIGFVYTKTAQDVLIEKEPRDKL